MDFQKYEKNIDGMNQVRENQQITKPTKHLFSNRVYASHPERKQNPFSHYCRTNLKSRSMVLLSPKTCDTFTNKLEACKECEIKIKASDDLIDSCTQTSRTILQLAKMETDGRFSPDSLMQSPRDEDAFLDVNKKLDILPIKLMENLSNRKECDDSYEKNQIPFSRKENLMQYLKGQNIIKHFDESESETFIEKNNFSSEVTNSYRSKFLQQKSPLKNLVETKKTNRLKSQSYVEGGHSRNEEFSSRFSIKSVRNKIYVDQTAPVNYYCQKQTGKKILNEKTSEASNSTGITPKQSPTTRSFSKKRSNSFMLPTISTAIKNKQVEISTLNCLIPSTRRGRSTSPQSYQVSNRVEKITSNTVPYIDKSESEVSLSPKYITPKENFERNRRTATPMHLKPATIKPIFEEDLLKIDGLSIDLRSSRETVDGFLKGNDSTSSTSVDNAIGTALSKLRNRDWPVALKGLAEIVEICRLMDADLIFPHMVFVNQRLIELLRSPRSHVCRTACQAAGHLFESMKDIRRPEFDDIVDILLTKTADANKFIRQDANLSLDCMVTHIPTFHAIRALCSKGPDHKNPLVRTATVRLIICAVVIAGTNVIFNINNNEHTRKRIILYMFKFLEDKNLETRKYGERLYKILYKEQNFDIFLKKYLEKEQILQLKKSLKFLQSKR